MTLGQALALVQQKRDASRRRTVFLACGFEPLHLATLLKGHLLNRFPDSSAEVQTGLYGDVAGALTAAAASPAEAEVAVVEWSDLDPRLGLRSAGGWAISVQADIIRTCRERCARLTAALRELGRRMPVALVPPTLPVALLGHTAGWQLSLCELELRAEVAAFLSEAASIGGVSVLNPSRLARLSPEDSRLDALMELKAGFPYTISHASAVAGEAVKLLFPPAPMKGLITDLDETLWSGIVGEVGARGVAWGIAEDAQVHGLYQQMLQHLSEMGVLLAIASKNEAAVVDEALGRDDLLVDARAFFPVYVNWGPKSHGVAEILRVWNIGADSVAFVDDSPMELEEARTAFPAITCLQFQPTRPAKVLELLEQLRDLFGKPVIQPEDALRRESIRANAAFAAEADGSAAPGFVRGLQGRVTFDCRKEPPDRRLLELINKTNQFNLNGIRVTEGEWLRQLEDQAARAIGVSYEDRFGRLGTIGVLAGRLEGEGFELRNWVMSCRAFSRQIEDHMLDFLFRLPGVKEVRMAFRATERNQPLRNYLASFGLEVNGDGELALSREQFLSRRGDLPHQTGLHGND